MRRRAALAALALIPLFSFWVVIVCSNDISRTSWVHLFLFSGSVVLWLVWGALVRARKFLGQRAVSFYLRPETERRVQWLAMNEDVSVEEWVARTVAQQSLLQAESQRLAQPR